MIPLQRLLDSIEARLSGPVEMSFGATLFVIFIAVSAGFVAGVWFIGGR